MGCTFESGGMSHTIIELRIVPLAYFTPFLMRIPILSL
jgi:hypothetical protein